MTTTSSASAEGTPAMANLIARNRCLTISRDRRDHCLRDSIRLRRRILLLTVAACTIFAGVRSATGATSSFSLGLDQIVPPALLTGSPTRSGHPGHAQLPALPQPDPLPPTAFRQPHGFPVRVIDDIPALVTRPLDWHRPDWIRLGLGAVVVGAVSLLDEPVDSWFDSRHTVSTVNAADTVRPLGQEGGVILLGAAWLGGHLTHNDRLRSIGVDGLEASLLTTMLVTPLKLGFGRERPRDTGNHQSFFSKGSSFPSGEAAQAFTVAAVVAAHSDRTWVKATAWSLAGLVGAERLTLDAHWLSDVVAGAFIGTAVGHWVVAHNRPTVESALHVSVTPVVAKNRYGVAIKLLF